MSIRSIKATMQAAPQPSGPQFIHPLIGHSVMSGVDKVIDWMRVRGYGSSPDNPEIEECLREGVTRYMTMLAHAVQKVTLDECRRLAEASIVEELDKTLNSSSIEVATDAEANRLIIERRQS